VFQPFVVDEVNGSWGNAIQVPGTPANADGFDVVASISCQSAGNCVAGLSSAVGNTLQAFVVSEVNGTWGEASQIPGLSAPAAVVTSVSCPPTGSCAAGGEFADHHRRWQ
jgi:hypothetical protein